MAQLMSLSVSLAAFTAAALLLALIASVVLIASEELGRGYVNAWLLSRWVRTYGAPRDLIMHDLRRWLWLPYRQMTGIIASFLQADALPRKLYARVDDESRPTVRDYFVMIGASMIGLDLPLFVQREFSSVSRPPGYWEESSEAEIHEGVRSMLADRALDDLQATLALQWARLRYAAAAVAIAITFGFVQIQLGSGERFGLLHVAVAFPAILLVAVFFAPLFRDLIEQVTARQR